MKRWFCILLPLFVLLASSACGRAIGSASATRTSRLPDQKEVKALLVKLVDEEIRAPGIVIGMIADDPQERWTLGYGKLGIDDERVPDGDTVFEIGSITKVFTGTLLAQAVVNGEVRLDDPISLYLPEGVVAPEYEGRAITLLDLATHASGLPRMPTNFHPKERKNPYADYTFDQVYDFLSGYRLRRAPGSSFEYSNYGMGLLGNLLVRRAGRADYEALLLDRIARPLGMDSTRVQLTPEMRSRLAAPHANYLLPSEDFDIPTLAGAGGILSTANDLLTFLAANMGMTETELLAAMQLANTPQRPTDGPDYIGLGWSLPKSVTGIHQHGGRTGGYDTYLAWDPQRKIGVVVLANAAVDIDDVALQLMRGLLKPFQVDPQVLAVYAGKYQVSADFFVTIRVDDTRIFLQAPNQPEYELFARSDSQFYPREFDAELTFYKNAGGEVDRLVLLQGGVITEAKKVP